MPSNSSTSAMRAHLESQVAFMSDLTRKTYDSARKLSELNLHFTQDWLEDSFTISRQLLAAGDPFQFSATLANQIQPLAQRIRSYQQQLIGLLSGAQVDFTRATESFMPEASRSASAIADDMARRAEEASRAFAPRYSGNGAASGGHGGDGGAHHSAS